MSRVRLPILLAVAVLGWTPHLIGQPRIDPIVGTYAWFSQATVVIRERGTVVGTFPDGKVVPGRWVANPYGGYVIMWEGGWVDSLKLTPNGNRLEGSGLTPDGNVQTIVGNRRNE